jgi:hypothetical protein
MSLYTKNRTHLPPALARASLLTAFDLLAPVRVDLDDLLFMFPCDENDSSALVCALELFCDENDVNLWAIDGQFEFRPCAVCRWSKIKLTCFEKGSHTCSE